VGLSYDKRKISFNLSWYLNLNGIVVCMLIWNVKNSEFDSQFRLKIFNFNINTEYSFINGIFIFTDSYQVLVAVTRATIFLQLLLKFNFLLLC